MNNLILLNKPFQVMCQFTDENSRRTLAEFIAYTGFYAAGRLDFDSEGLLLLTNDGALQNQIADPRHKMPKTYWVQVEGELAPEALTQLANGVQLKDGVTKPANVKIIDPPQLWDREPPVRFRKTVPDQWLELTITEGKNRQVRRMTAAVGHPTLRLVRVAIGPWQLGKLQPGESQLTHASVHVMPNKTQRLKQKLKPRATRPNKAKRHE